MQTQTEVNAPRRRNGKADKPLGRKDKDKQEAVIRCDVVRENIADLILLYNRAGAAATDYGDKVKAIAEMSGLLASTIRRFVTARAGNDFAEDKRKVQQMALVFDEVGEDSSVQGALAS